MRKYWCWQTATFVVFPNVSIHRCVLKEWIRFSIISRFDDLVSVCVLTLNSVRLRFLFAFFFYHFILFISLSLLSFQIQALVNGDKIYNNYCFHLIRYIVDLSRFASAPHSSHEQKANRGIQCVKLNECLMENKWLTSQ